MSRKPQYLTSCLAVSGISGSACGCACAVPAQGTDTVGFCPSTSSWEPFPLDLIFQFSLDWNLSALCSDKRGQPHAGLCQEGTEGMQVASWARSAVTPGHVTAVRVAICPARMAKFIMAMPVNHVQLSHGPCPSFLHVLIVSLVLR